MSRIFYRGKFFDYPLKASNALGNLGVIEAIRCVLSYVWVRIRPPKDLTTFEGWVASRFGWRLYRIFFKTYTEKVWGVPAHEIQADWAAQRIKNLSLFKAVMNAVLPKRGSTEITSLIDRFQYPALGPGMLWEECAKLVTESGSTIEFKSRVCEIRNIGNRLMSVEYLSKSGERTSVEVKAVVSSMPLPDLIRAISPAVPNDVLEAANGLIHRDFMTIALVLPDESIFPDNWIYIHDPSVNVGRIQNFRSWSPFMVKDGFTCLGLEYFVNKGDELWEMSDKELIDLGIKELASLNIVDTTTIIEGHVVRMPKAYPMYDAGYQKNVDLIRNWLSANLPDVYPVGRNGMHRYNNQDHSMLTAMLAVENMYGAQNDIWSVNVDDDYHEEKKD
jgi:protoporphyrinogen oxidase